VRPIRPTSGSNPRALNRRGRLAGVEPVEIESWDQFFPAIKDATNALGCDTVWYRGHIDARYALIPTLFRMGLNTSASVHAEKNAFDVFDRRVQRLRGTGEARRDWHVLVDMQHHGVPTRLLDWTSVLGIAVFFATARYSTAQEAIGFAIYVLDPVGLNQTVGRAAIYSSEDGHFGYKSIYWDHRPFVPGGAIALDTPFVNDRVYAQQGLFTVHVDDRPLEQVRPDVIRKIVLHPSCVAGAREFLAHANLNDATVFPDMEGLVRYVRTQMYSLGAVAMNPAPRS